VPLREKRGKNKALRRDLLREGFYAGGGELEADQPFAGDATGAHFGRSEFPAAEGFLRSVRKILAGSRILEFGRGNVACGIDVGAESHADFAGNRGQRFVGDVGQNLIEDFAFSGSGCGALGGVGRGFRLCAECSGRR